MGFLDTHDFINAELRFREALKLAPASVPVLTNLAAALFARDKVTEALEFAKRAIANDANNIDACLIIAGCFAKKRQYAEVLASCDKIIELEPALVETYINRAAALIELNRPEESLASCDRAIAIAPNLTNAHYSRGNALIRLGRYQEALASYDKSIAIKPDFAKAWIGRGDVFLELKRHAEAAAAYGKALSIDPDIEEAEGALLHMKMFSCDWSGFENDCLRVMTGVRKGLPVTPPFVIVAIPSTPADQLKCAKNYVTRVFPFRIIRSGATNYIRTIEFASPICRPTSRTTLPRISWPAYLNIMTGLGFRRPRFRLEQMTAAPCVRVW